MESKWLYFEEVFDGRKTKMFRVCSKSGNQILGMIKWYSPWRQYCFFAERSTVWSDGCLEDIIKFIKELKDEA
jgi:hypothetical protein